MSCGPLDGSMLAAAESQRTIILTAADWSMFDLFGVNWLTHVRKAGITNYLMAALDQVGVGLDTSGGRGKAVGGSGWPAPAVLTFCLNPALAGLTSLLGCPLHAAPCTWLPQPSPTRPYLF